MLCADKALRTNVGFSSNLVSENVQVFEQVLTAQPLIAFRFVKVALNPESFLHSGLQSSCLLLSVKVLTSLLSNGCGESILVALKPESKVADIIAACI